MTVDPAKARDRDIDAYLQDFSTESDACSDAREHGGDAGADPIGPATGAALRFLAASVQARAVVEVGTGAGVSGLYLLAGMATGGVLTTIDVEPEHQRSARRAFAAAGHPAGRARLIMGRGLDVLPRLTDAGYDLVFVDAMRVEYPRYYEQGVQLLRQGGVLAFEGVFSGGRVAEPNRRDAQTGALRELAHLVHDDERLTPAFVPLADGLLVAAKVTSE